MVTSPLSYDEDHHVTVQIRSMEFPAQFHAVSLYIARSGSGYVRWAVPLFASRERKLFADLEHVLLCKSSDVAANFIVTEWQGQGLKAAKVFSAHLVNLFADTNRDPRLVNYDLLFGKCKLVFCSESGMTTVWRHYRDALNRNVAGV